MSEQYSSWCIFVTWNFFLFPLRLLFLENIIAKYPEGKTVIGLDNARIHHAKLI
ncbi:hypothetical protein K7P76_16935 [Cohnella sp. NL03-T5]|nr:hypothetical protein [Cohnella silvisoli]